MEYNSPRQLVQRFTDDMYARKEDVRKALNTSLIDPIWAKIISYRRNYYKNLKISDIAKRNYFICYVEKISDICNEVINKINKNQEVYRALDDAMKLNLKNKIDVDIIASVNHLYSENELKSDFISLIIKNQINLLQGLSNDKIKSNNYYQLLKSLNYSNKIDEDYAVLLFSKLTNNNNLVRLYRNFDFPYNPLLIRNGITHHQIERMMNELYTFIFDNSELAIIRASMAYYYINYVKPFDDYNQEIAMLVFKSILSNEINNNYPFFLPLEKYFFVKDAFVHEIKEAEKTDDFTYFLLKTITLLNKAINEFTSVAERIHIDVLTNEHDLKPSVILDEMNHNNEDIAPKNNEVIKEEKVLETKVDVIKEEIKPTIIKEEIEPKKEEIKPTVVKEDEHKEEIKPKTVKIKEKVVVKAAPYTPNNNNNLTSIVNIDEKDANRFAKYLLEKNPLLKKKEAHFYARHSIIGSYYTIQMYKNFENVVYETARTSMDSLVKFGYYRKEQIKNKFVYTPNKIEGK